MVDIDFNRIISSAMKSGKVLLGSKQALTASRTGRAVAIIAASNCPLKTFIDLKSHSSLFNIPLFTYPASSLDLGIACKKPFAVSVLTIRELTEPEVLKIIHKSNNESESEDK